MKVANKFADSKVGGLGAGGLSLLAAASFGELLPPLEATTAAAVMLRSRGSGGADPTPEELGAVAAELRACIARLEATEGTL